MLTSGKWVEDHDFWTGFFNPTYFASAAVRTAIAFALAGVYALVTASRQKDPTLKARLVKWSHAGLACQACHESIHRIIEEGYFRTSIF